MIKSAKDKRIQCRDSRISTGPDNDNWEVKKVSLQVSLKGSDVARMPALLNVAVPDKNWQFWG